MPLDQATFTGTDHIVLAVRDLEAGIRNWRDGLGMTLSHRADLHDAGIRQAFFTMADHTFIELIAPMNASSSLADLLARRGEGIHVLALRVDDLDATIARFQEAGVRLTGVGTPQVFIHPSATNGVLVQLWPRDRPHRWRDEEAR